MEPAIEARHLTVDDDTTIAVDLLTPVDPVGTVIVCHPHPLYGGSRHDAVVAAVVDGALAAGWRAVRFDFRGAGDSTGEHGGGGPERHDVMAVLDLLGEGERCVLAGYSFGADVALSVTDPRIEGWIGVAPVLRVFASFATAADPRPKLLVTGGHDQFHPAGELRRATAAWLETEPVEFPSADHFFGGHHAAVRDRAAAWLAP